MKLLLSVAIATAALLAVVTCNEESQSDGLSAILTRSKRQLTARLHTPRRGGMQLNVIRERGNTIHIGFTHVQGASGYFVSAKEYSNGRIRQFVSTDEKRVGQHQRDATLENLFPGREYLIQIQALNRARRPLGSVSETVANTALRCYVCNGRASNNECKGENNILECPSGTDSCLNELRYQNGLTTVTKRCTQYRPEFANQFRGGRDATQACKGTIARDSFCQCACKSDLCNEAELPCATRCFPELSAPQFGFVSCSNLNREGSICRWTCGGGRRLVGVDRSVCRSDGTWSVLTPANCVLEVRQDGFECPRLGNPTNGRVSCTNGNADGSTCSYTCNNGFQLSTGSARRVCSRTAGRWSGSNAGCSVITCPRIVSASHRTVACTSSNRVGSVCTITCADTYTLTGSDSITCGQGGVWSAAVATCERRGCYVRPRVSRNVLADCEDTSTGASCTYTCKPGYSRQGAATSVCRDGRWGSAAPTCIKNRCQTALPQPQFGFVRCSDQRYSGSVCTFTCQRGYSVIGPAAVTCQTSGTWSNIAPRCRRISCPQIGQLAQGSYSCNNANNEGSLCTFRCNSGYGIPSTSRSRITCGAARGPISPDATYTGAWNYPIPTCEKVRCPELTSPSGLSRTCTRVDYREVGSMCTHSCRSGYTIAGRARITCKKSSRGQARGYWSPRQPYCVRRQCRRLGFIQDGDISCTEARYAGSVCTATCDHGYELIGNSEVRCNNDGRWNRANPTCRRVICRETAQLQTMNLEFKCGQAENVDRGIRQFFADFVCPVQCSGGYSISGGNNVTCGTDGNWVISQHLTCADLNECNEDNGGCDHICINEIGGFTCECFENYKLGRDGRTCILTVCPELEQDDRQILDCSNGRRIGSSCTVGCIAGYEPTNGASSFSCEVDGSWTGRKATCTKIQCSVLRSPFNGELSCTEANVFGSVCTTQCDEGFRLVGEPQAECTASRLWTFNVPRCRRIQCSEEQTSLINGRADCTNANFYQSQCNYFCNAGYQIVNEGDGAGLFGLQLFAVSDCLSDGTWSFPTPTCEKRQCFPALEDMIQERSNSEVTCTDNDLFESTCTITCDTGYQLIGQIRTTCSQFQTWTQDLGQCEKIQCPEYLELSNGYMTCSESNFYESICSFKCNEGYDMIGTAFTHCQADRTWNQRRPRCQIVQCDEAQTSVPDGTVSCTAEHFYGSVCTTTCNPGYEFDRVTVEESVRKNSVRLGLLSNDSRGGDNDVIMTSCQASGEWDSSRPTCVKHSCAPRVLVMDQNRPNGRLFCSDGELFLSVCRLQCEVGYEIVDGTESTQCTEIRQWSTQLGQCTRVSCQAFEGFENGAMTCSNTNLYESTCEFACNSGYDLIGESSSTCQADRTFTNAQPRCRKIECPTTHTSLENGNATCTDGVRFESRCVYVCNPGYEMIGTTSSEVEDNIAVLTCMADRTWGGVLPVCNRKRCSIQDGALTRAKLNGVVDCTEGTFFRSLCTVRCNDGYELVGPATTRCTAAADWGPTIGYCEKVRCPELSEPANSEMTCTDENRFESVCSFQCDFGYERIGAVDATCQADRTYTNAPPTCREILCPISFTTLGNGEATCSDSNRYASRCAYVCDAGYELSSTSVSAAICQLDYNWNAESEPQCIKSRCLQADPIILAALEHGSTVCTDENRYESECTLTCDSGYELTGGSGITVCLSNQMWRNTFGYCIKIRCPAFEELENGASVCSDENRFESRCEFACDPGYELIGDEESVCQANRQFSNALPTCQKIRCSDTFLSIENGDTECSESNLFESVCEYSCALGYEVTAGSDRTECKEDQAWSQERAVCEKKICPADDENLARADENGEVSCTEEHVYDSVCSVVCDVGYEMVEDGLDSTRCNENALWEDTIGYCVKIQCERFEAVDHGSSSCSESNLYLSSCDFECDAGYEMVGSSSTTCQADRTWTSEPPACFKIRCSEEYLSLEHGSATCTDANRFQSSCSYECDRGYEPASTDVTTATCTEFETWNSHKPTCSKRQCPRNHPSLLRADNIGTVTCSEENLFESNCFVECPSGYELVEGERQITCLDTAQWSGEMGHCQKIICEALNQPDNGEMICSDDARFESICSFVCDPGYYMSGEQESVCQADRRFSSAAPECRKISCSIDHLSIVFGSTECTEENLFESVCEYRCQTGYQFLDSDFIVQEAVTSECLEDGQWSKVVPICEKRTCPHDDEDFVEALESGQVVCTEGNRFGSVCEINCEEGHEVTGQSVVTCLEAGNWNESIGKCLMIECPPYTPPPFGDITCTNDFNFDTQCEFTCNEGHQFIDESLSDRLAARRDELPASIRVECTQDRVWTVRDTPQCEKKTCPWEEQGWNSIENGNVTCTDANRYTSQCFYQCGTGYELVEPRDGDDVTSVLVMCMSDGEWDVSEVPRCRRIQCSPNVTSMQEAEEHGRISCTEGSEFESRCELTCNRGYNMNNEQRVTECQEDREWSIALAACEKIECPELVAPEHSSITCTDDFIFKSHCKVHCDPGYEIVDPEDEYDVERGISCRSDASWCGELPQCEKITCSDEHLRIESGSVECTESNVFESVCSYTCDAGYHMIQGQSDTAECTEEKRWSSTVPVCQNNRCPANDSSLLEARINGDVTCTDENKFGSQCMLQCFGGYEMTGELTTSCLEDKEWSNGLGLCRKISCPDVVLPPNTTLLCTDEFRYESTCITECVAGFRRVEEAYALDELMNDYTCGADGTWSGVIHRCERLQCPIEGYEIVENGRVSCDDGNNFESECIFVCDTGYILADHFDNDVSDPSVRCTADGSWSMEEAPRCIPVQCRPTAEHLGEGITNGELSCTRASEFGSRCTLRCNNGYEVIGDYDYTECENNKQWWPAIGNCQKVQCPELILPPYAVTMDCSDEYNFDSTCNVVTCEPGYVLSNPEESMRTCTDVGIWSGVPAECIKKQCAGSYMHPENGNVVCTDESNFQSECHYFCSPSFELNSPVDSAMCLSSGEWSVPIPLCIPRRTCASTVSIAYFSLGIINCRNDFSCRLICDPGTELIGTGVSTCIDHEDAPIEWSPPLGVCRKRSCSAPEPLENGITMCSNNHLFRSVCRFRCNEGYRLVGSVAARCRADGEWGENTPTCQAITCDYSELDIEHGFVSTTNSNFSGSVATYECTEDGYELIGAQEVTCLRNGQWSEPTPICRLGRCPPLNLPNGRVQCNRDIHNEYGSECSYTCNDLYQIQGESTMTACGFDGRWTNPRPHCRGHCDIDYSTFEDGFVFCTDSNYHNSQCSFHCGTAESVGREFQLFGSKQITCQEDGRWTGTPPCCARSCPPWGKIDLFFVLDSSDSVGYQNWTKVVGFVNQFVSSFNIGNDALLVGVVRYNRDVDVRGEIPLGAFQNLQPLQRAITFLPYGGWGTNTGRALSHVTSDSLRVSSNRPDVHDYVIVITDGESQDDVTLPAQMLKSQDTTVFAIGIGNTEVRREELLTIASDPDDVFMTEGGFNGLDHSLVDSITRNICDNPCMLNQRYREQTRGYQTSDRR